ncbi:MAG: hypothetical protein IJ364_08625 [Oscillospiraceae bacterium]|nr:hypothetical protein [Oscillospiraceae bacterium]
MKNSSNLWQRFSAWVDGEAFSDENSTVNSLGQLPEAFEKETEKKQKKHLSHLHQQMIAYGVTAVVICLVMIFVLMSTVAALPVFGSTDTPTLNEVSDRYLEKGMEETGAVNAVAGLILDYRAFDTFGESTVLFAATMSVIFLTRSKHGKELAKKGPFAGGNPDPIFQTMGKLLLPFIMLFGIYVVLNGHLSPGGGFSGGAILGGGLILAASVFGQDVMSEKVNATLTTGLSVTCLMAYAVMKGYSFYTGANHVGWEIPKGTPGNILSSGFILPLNICVGVIVACTMYTFFSLFSQAEED